MVSKKFNTRLTALSYSLIGHSAVRRMGRKSAFFCHRKSLVLVPSAVGPPSALVSSQSSLPERGVVCGWEAGALTTGEAWSRFCVPRDRSPRQLHRTRALLVTSAGRLVWCIGEEPAFYRQRGPVTDAMAAAGQAKKGWKAQPVDWRPPSKLPQANGYMNGYSHVSPAGEGLGGPSYESSFSSSGSGSEGGASASNRQNTVSVARARSTQLAGISENEK